jgi:SPP1 gp7 family putative phage head morphogenesis protein
VGEYWLITAADPVKLSKEDNDLIKKLFDQENIPYHPGTMFQDTDQLAKALAKGFGKQAFTYASADNLAYTMMEINLNRFGFNKNVAEITELNNALRESGNFQEFKDKAKEIIGTFKTHHLRTEYDLAVATGQNSARYLNQLAEAAVFPYLQYQTAGDDKVREEHAALDGKVFGINDPELSAIYPPNGFNCRCEMVQIDSDEASAIGITPASEGKGLMGEEWDKMQKYGFDRNPAETGEIFDLNRIYAQQLEQTTTRDLYDLTFNDINLPMADALKATLKHGKMELKDQSQETLLKAFDKKAVKVNETSFNLYKDYAGRPVGLSRQTLTGQTSGSFLSPQEARHAIFTNLDDVMARPDEVWLVPLENNAYKQVYIRYYKDDVMMASTLVDMEEGRRISSWSRMKQEVPNRRGLLIYKSYGSK